MKHNTKQFLPKILTLLILAVVSACASTETATRKGEDLTFQLFILRETWSDLKLGYDPEPSQTILANADTSNSLFAIGIDQIEEYNWDLQTLMLTKDATAKLVESLAAQGVVNDEGLRELLDLKESLGYGNPIERALYIHAFVVKVNGESKYGGIFLDVLSQMGIDFPVIRVTLVDGKAVLAILPIQIPFAMSDPIDGAGNFKEPVFSEDVQQDTQLLDFFSGAIKSFATSESAVRFRALIRHDDILKIFKNAGG